MKVQPQSPPIKPPHSSVPPATFQPHILTRRPQVRCTRHRTIDTWFARAILVLAAGVFLFNLIRFLGR
jgi:hypothetical protein